MGGRSSVFFFRIGYDELPRLEARIDRLRFDDPVTRHSVKIIVTELFDNIVAHAAGVHPPFVAFCISSSCPATIRLMYRTTNFVRFVAALDAAVASKQAGGDASRPDFDHASDRYRGLGLRMCASLSREIIASPGLFCQRVLVVL